MEKLWLNNELVDRLAMLQQTEADHDGINQIAIEKDWWMTATLKALFQTDCRDALTFKGGTSLSKGFKVVDRFSEDIDLAISHSFFRNRCHHPKPAREVAQNGSVSSSVSELSPQTC